MHVIGDACLESLLGQYVNTLGVGLGGGVIVFMSALLNGLQANFIRRVLTAQAHIQLLPPQEKVRPLRGGTPGELEAAQQQLAVALGYLCCTPTKATLQVISLE